MLLLDFLLMMVIYFNFDYHYIRKDGKCYRVAYVYDSTDNISNVNITLSYSFSEKELEDF